MGFLDTLLTAINEQQAASAFGPDWRLKERRARLDERQAELDAALRRAQTMKATREWDAKLRAAQQLHPDLAPEEALAKAESEDIDLGRQTKRAIIGLREAQAVKAKAPPPRRAPFRYTTDEGVFAEDLDTGERRRLGDRPRNLRVSTGAAQDAPLGAPFELKVTMPDGTVQNRTYFRTKGGVIPAEQAVPGATGLGRTAEQRNIEYHAGAVEPVFSSVDSALQDLEAASGGSFGALPSAVPGTQAYWARQNYQALAQNLLSTVVARQAGEGSRLSDQDRAAYAKAIGLVRGQLFLPGGVAQARQRLDQARALLAEVEARRQGSTSNVPDFEDVTSGGSSEEAEPEIEISYEDLFSDEEQ